MKSIIKLRDEVLGVIGDIEERRAAFQPTDDLDAELHRLACESLEDVGLAHLSHKALLEALEARIRVAKALADQLEVRIALLRRHELEAMQATGTPKFKNEYFSLGVQAGRGRVVLKPGFDLKDAPPIYVKRKVELSLDMDLVRSALEAGDVLGFAELVVDDFVVLRPTQAWRDLVAVRALETDDVRAALEVKP